MEQPLSKYQELVEHVLKQVKEAKQFSLDFFDLDFYLFIFQFNFGSRCFSLKRNHGMIFYKAHHSKTPRSNMPFNTTEMTN